PIGAPPPSVADRLSSWAKDAQDRLAALQTAVRAKDALAAASRQPAQKDVLERVRAAISQRLLGWSTEATRAFADPVRSWPRTPDARAAEAARIALERRIVEPAVPAMQGIVAALEPEIRSAHPSLRRGLQSLRDEAARRATLARAALAEVHRPEHTIAP